MSFQSKLDCPVNKKKLLNMLFRKFIDCDRLSIEAINFSYKICKVMCLIKAADVHEKRKL